MILIFRLCQVTEDVESKVENSEEVNSAKNLEYKTRKDADEPLMDVGYKTRKEVDEPPTDVEHKTRMDVDEPTTDVEHKTMNDMEELKLVKDVSEMKSKLNGLESKLSEVSFLPGFWFPTTCINHVAFLVRWLVARVPGFNETSLAAIPSLIFYASNISCFFYMRDTFMRAC